MKQERKETDIASYVVVADREAREDEFAIVGGGTLCKPSRLVERRRVGCVCSRKQGKRRESEKEDFHTDVGTD